MACYLATLVGLAAVALLSGAYFTGAVLVLMAGKAVVSWALATEGGAR